MHSVFARLNAVFSILLGALPALIFLWLPEAQAAGGRTMIYHYADRCKYSQYQLRVLKDAAYARHIKVENGCGTTGLSQLVEMLGHGESKPDAIAIHAIVPANTAPVLHEAAKAQIPVLYLEADPGDQILNSAGENWFIGPNSRALGRLQSMLLKEYIDNHPKWDRNGDGQLSCLLVKGSEELGETQSRTKNFKAGIRKLKLPVKIIAELNSNFEQDKARELLTETFSDHPERLQELEAVVCNNDILALGTLEALQALHYNEAQQSADALRVPIIGIGGMQEALAEIERGTLYGTVLYDAPDIIDPALDIAVMFHDQHRINIDAEQSRLQRSEHRLLVPYQIVYKNFGEVMVKRRVDLIP